MAVETTDTDTLYLGNDRKIPATGRRLCLPVTWVHAIRYDKFVTSDVYFDQFDLLPNSV